MATIYVFFADGFEEIEAVTTIDTLRRGGLTVKTTSITGERIVTGAHDIPVICDQLFENSDFNDADMLLLPGGMPGASTLDKHEGLKTLIRQFANDKKPLAAICAAPMVLGNMGLLTGKKATCYPGFEQYLEGADCINQPVVKDENIITGMGPGAALAFSLKIVETMVSPEKAKELAEAMCYKGSL